jgi:plasmid maintenance system killer protein
MIKTFADKGTRELFATGATKRFPPDVARRAARKLEYVDLATNLDDLKVPPGNRLGEGLILTHQRARVVPNATTFCGSVMADL